MNNEWSDTAKEESRLTLETLGFSVRDSKVFFKRNNGDFGFMKDGDALRGYYKIHTKDSEMLEVYTSITELLDHGWILD